MFHSSITVLIVIFRGFPSRSFANCKFSITFGSAAGFDNGFVGSACSASRLTTNPVTPSRIFGLRSSSVPFVISSTDRNLFLNRAASTIVSMSARSVGSPPVITIESVSRRIFANTFSVPAVGNSWLKTSGSFCVQ